MSYQTDSEELSENIETVSSPETLSIWGLAWPSILANILFAAAGVVSIKAVGILGTEAVAAVVNEDGSVVDIIPVVVTVKINEDKNRLENLGIFSGVSWSLMPLEDGTVTLKYIITESIQKTPPTVFPSYNENKGWSLNALWFLNNFRGRNQLLALSGSLGGEAFR